MKGAKIQWHPGFVAAMDLELMADRGKLSYETEHNLNVKPLEIDLLVMKKNGKARLRNEIGRLFRRYNIVEYKSPRDHLDIDTFYKVQSYAGLYKSYGRTVDERKTDEITVSLIRETKPAGLFQYLQKRNTPIKNPYPGIYYVLGGVLFRTQIIVIRELERENHIWLKALSDQLDKQEIQELLERVQELDEKYDRQLADAVLEVSTRANREIVEQLRGDGTMCKALLEIMEPEINRIVETTVKTEARKSILNAVKSFRDLGISDAKIIEMLTKNYACTPQKARSFL